MSSEYSFAKLNGSANYSVWALKMESILTRDGLEQIIDSDDVSDIVNRKGRAALRLAIEDGPLLLIRNELRAHNIWKFLKKLYSPQGFSHSFLIWVELNQCKLKDFGSMEEYIYRIRQLVDDLKSKGRDYPKDVLLALVLTGLTSEYKILVSNINQSLRAVEDIDSYDMDAFFANLIDESKRLKTIDSDPDTALLASLRGYYHKKNTQNQAKNKVSKKQYCTKCHKKSHSTSECFFLHPHKAPKGWVHKTLINPQEKLDQNTSSQDQSQNILISHGVEDITLPDLDFDHNIDLVFISSHNDSTSSDSIPNIESKPITLLLNSTNEPRFILDSGATKHIVCEKSYFTKFETCQRTVKWGNAKSVNINGVGTIYIRFKNNPTIYCLPNCLYMPELGVNIISQSEISGENITIFDKSHVIIKSQEKIIASGKKINNLYYMDIDKVVRPGHLLHNAINLHTKHTETIDISDLHSKMGHMSHDNIQRLLQNTVGYTKVTNHDHIDMKNCETCIRSKFTNQINKSSTGRTFDYLEKVSSDICGPLTPETYDHHKYFITFLDAKSRFLEVKLLKSKDEAYEAFNQYANLYENNPHGKRIRILATDNGAEYTSKRFKTVLHQKGITHQLSPAYTKEPNGLVERVNRTIVNKIRCLLINSHLPKELWGEACVTAAHIYNRSPHTGLGFKTPYEIKYGHKPNIAHIKTFGSICYYKNKGNHLKKLDEKAIQGVLVGFNNNLYKVYNPVTRRSLWSRDVHIMENKFLKSLPTSNPEPQSSQVNFGMINNSFGLSEPYSNVSSNIHTHTHTRSNETSMSEDHPHTSNNIDELSNSVSSNFCMDKYVKLTKSQTNIESSLDDHQIDELALLININSEPNTYKEAMTSHNSQEWQKAMQYEINELQSQNTWTLSPLPQDRTPLQGRWIYKLKTDLDGNIVKYKARWVVKGYNQKEGIDYMDTFSTTCRPESYRLIFMLAVSQNWQLNQYDVKNAFIHAKIDTEIYVEQPKGFTSTDHKSQKLYCKLNKALYGLKQSPRLWYEYLLSILQKHGFIAMPYDCAIFIDRARMIIIVCHVDDLIITGPCQATIEIFILEVTKIIKLEKIGNINQFLGMQIETDYKTKHIRINQKKYTMKLLSKFNKSNMTPVTSPVELGVYIEKSKDQATEANIQRYQQEVGSLIYLAINTRPDISFAVNRCARFMSNPNDTHFRALDRIWKYLNKYPDLGLNYDCNTITEMAVGYTDADWGGDIIARKSTSGYIFSINNNIISWLSMQQKTVALSSCEAEYMALREAIKESIYLNNLIKYYFTLLKIRTPQDIPMLLTDSESALKLANNPEFHKRTKHIDISYHFIRDSVKQKVIEIQYINTKLQKADGFTKGLDTIKHKSFLLSLNLK